MISEIKTSQKQNSNRPQSNICISFLAWRKKGALLNTAFSVNVSPMGISLCLIGILHNYPLGVRGWLCRLMRVLSISQALIAGENKLHSIRNILFYAYFKHTLTALESEPRSIISGRYQGPPNHTN